MTTYEDNKDPNTYTTHIGVDGIEDSILMDYCEWCGMTYPRGHWDYYEITVFKKYHKICSDCKDQLKLVK